MDIGGSSLFRIKWVMVDQKADQDWKTLNRRQQDEIVSIIRNGSKLVIVDNEFDKLIEKGVYNDIKFYLYAIEDDQYEDRMVFYSNI